MDNPNYRIESFEGPLDLLLALIRKNKINIYDIPIALLCDQYFEYMTAAEEAKMELASEFLVMASELMLIKTRMLLPRKSEEEPDPRKELSDALYRYAEAKAAAVLLSALYAQYHGRLEKEPEDVSPDRTYVAENQSPEKLAERIHLLNAMIGAPSEEEYGKAFAPMMKRPVIPVEVKVTSMIHRLAERGPHTMAELLKGEPTLPDLVASFMGILELLKLRRILIDKDCDGTDGENAVHSSATRFILNTESVGEDVQEYPASDSPS